MADKVAVLDPEPITLLDTEDEPGISQSRRSSIANSNFYIERAFVTNCTIISGERSTPKFAVWKVTAVLHPLNPNSSGSYRIHTYSRYSDFVEFRNALLDRVRTKRPASVSEIPELPPHLSNGITAGSTTRSISTGNGSPTEEKDWNYSSTRSCSMATSWT